MFVSSGQAYVFIATVAFGGVFGVLYYPIAVLKTAKTPKIVCTVS